MDSHATAPGFKTWWVRYTFYDASDHLHTIIIKWRVRRCVWKVWRRIFQSDLTQDIKMGSCVLRCYVPHQWIAQRMVGPISVYCDGVGWHALRLRHGIPVWHHIGQSTAATYRLRHLCEINTEFCVKYVVFA